MESRENISLKEEMEDVCAFVNLEKLRFGDRIRFQTDIREENFGLPPLSVLALVENAFVHGLKKGDRKGTITVRSCRTPSACVVQVEDDGTGFDAEAYENLPGSDGPQAGGLLKVRYRMEAMVNGRMDIQSYAGAGTVVTLQVPVLERRA